MGFDSKNELFEESVLTSPTFIKAGISENLLNALQSTEECFFEKDYEVSEGKNKYIKYSLTPIEKGKIVREILLLVEDITLSKLAELEKERKAKYCDLTGLVNQNNFYLMLEDSIREADDQSYNLALLHLDIDDFRIINEQYGHPGGNEILKSVGNRIKNVTSSKYDCGFRVGGDEFAVIYTNYPEENLRSIVDRLIATLSTFYTINESKLKCTFSIGVAEYSGQKPKVLYKDADTATYHSKKEGKNTCNFFKQGMIMPSENP
jgi:diguanylate cyclase (GGDEF)-like protein